MCPTIVARRRDKQPKTLVLEQVVVEAVCGEPVSGGIFPANRESTGKFFGFRGKCAFAARKTALLSTSWRRFPYGAEQGIVFP